MPGVSTKSQNYSATWDGERWLRIGGHVSPGYKPIACATHTRCFSDGQMYDGTKWRSAPGWPTGAVKAISCPGPKLCIAIAVEVASGKFEPGDEKFDLVEYRYTGASWMREARVPLVGEIASVTCRADGACVAVGSTPTRVPLILRRDSEGTWGKESASGRSDLSSVSCPAVGKCSAVGNAIAPEESTTPDQWQPNGGVFGLIG